MIGCHDVIEHAQTEALLRFKKPMQIAAPITRKLQLGRFIRRVDSRKRTFRRFENSRNVEAPV